MKNYKSCEVCNCGDCKTGMYRESSWFCPILKRQICDVCCYYDMDDPNFNMRIKCKSIKCKYLKEK